MTDRLSNLMTFLRVAERRSLTAAAADLSVSQPTVTRAIAALEAELGARLFTRTTHSVSLTEAGRALLPRAHEVLAGWDGLRDSVQPDGALSGPLHVVAPVALGQTELLPALAAFQAEHPGVVVTWQLTDAPIRMAEIGCDLWIRVGDVPDDGLVQRLVGWVDRSVYGRPCFADRRLEDCPWIALGPYEGRRITLRDRTLTVEPVLTTNSVAVVGQALRQGIGIGIAPDWYLRDAVRMGDLVPLGASAQPLPVHLAFAPERRTRRLDAFAAGMEAHLKRHVVR